MNSGSEANDLAVNLARLYTGNHTIFALNGAYHGIYYIFKKISLKILGWAGSSAYLTGISSWKFPLPYDNGIKHVHANYDYHKMDFLTTE